MNVRRIHVLHPRKVAFASNLDFFSPFDPKGEIRVRVTGSNIGFLRKLRWHLPRVLGVTHHTFLLFSHIPTLSHLSSRLQGLSGRQTRDSTILHYFDTQFSLHVKQLLRNYGWKRKYWRIFKGFPHFAPPFPSTFSADLRNFVLHVQYIRGEIK